MVGTYAFYPINGSFAAIPVMTHGNLVHYWSRRYLDKPKRQLRFCNLKRPFPSLPSLLTNRLPLRNWYVFFWFKNSFASWPFIVLLHSPNFSAIWWSRSARRLDWMRNSRMIVLLEMIGISRGQLPILIRSRWVCFSKKDYRFTLV